MTFKLIVSLVSKLRYFKESRNICCQRRYLGLISKSQVEFKNLSERRKMLQEKIKRKERISFNDIPYEDRKNMQQTMFLLRITEIISSLGRLGIVGILVYWLYKKYGSEHKSDDEGIFGCIEMFNTDSGYILPKINESVIKSGTVKPYLHKLQKGDVLISGLPRSGISRIREIVWLLKNNMDFKSAKNVCADIRVPCIHETIVGNPRSYSFHDIIQNPSVFTSLIGLNINKNSIGKDVKIIYCVRNLRDVSISGYKLLKKTSHGNNVPSLFDFIEKNVKRGKSMYGPWWLHLNSLSAIDNQYLIISFEHFEKDPKACISEIAKFIGVNAVNEEQLTEMCDWICATNFKAQETTNYSWLKLTKLFSGDAKETISADEFRSIAGFEISEIIASQKLKLDTNMSSWNLSSLKASCIV